MAHILIAEHNPATSSYLVKALKKAGNTVTVIDNCLDAWRMTCTDTFDVLLLDLAMPGIDGFILAQNAVDSNPDLNVIFITGFAGVTLDTYGWLTAGGVPLMATPFHLRDIASRIGFLMGESGLPQRASRADSADNANIIYPNFRNRQEDTLNAVQS